jgi:hypothetical protein
MDAVRRNAIFSCCCNGLAMRFSRHRPSKFQQIHMIQVMEVAEANRRLGSKDSRI